MLLFKQHDINGIYYGGHYGGYYVMSVIRRTNSHDDR